MVKSKYPNMLAKSVNMVTTYKVVGLTDSAAILRTSTRVSLISDNGSGAPQETRASNF